MRLKADWPPVSPLDMLRRGQILLGQHDLSYRLFFSHVRMVCDLLREMVGETWVDRIDFASAERVGPVVGGSGAVGADRVPRSVRRALPATAAVQAGPRGRLCRGGAR